MLHNDITELKGIGPKKAQVLKDEASIETIEDFLYYRPRRYLDRSSFKQINDCFVNEEVTVAGNIEKKFKITKGKRRLEIIINDGTDILSGLFFGGTRYFDNIFNEGDYVVFSGKISFFKNKQIIHPEFDFIDSSSQIQSINTGRIIPLYPSTEALKGIGFDSRGFRRILKQIVDNYSQYINEFFDDSLLKRNNLNQLDDSLKKIHFPDTKDDIEIARKRLAFNEIFFLQYYLALKKKFIQKNLSVKTEKLDTSLFDDILNKIPFTLTDDQKKAVADIKSDMEQSYPMNRLLQGDVGSGKTVVALLASLLAVGQGFQTAVMAPTEVLAGQHFSSFLQLLGDSVSYKLLTGSTPLKEKDSIYDGIKDGSIDIIIGTHALIQGTVTFKNLGLIVIDEQHRFGVQQRVDLREKGVYAHMLVMTATPIPRSLSLTLYGDLDVSIIKEKPADRVPIKTMAFPESRLEAVYRSLEKYISQGRQIYYVLPLIEVSAKIDLKSATEVYEKLKNRVFKHRSVALLHGKLKSEEKEDIMRQFKCGDIDILVTTTVIEVGVDVSNANVIIIEHAERFGLSQLHQLRGRVGRGKHKSFCVLVSPDEISEESKVRINTMVEIDDGFAIAEEDLNQRGAGELIGVRQHGHAGSFEFTDLAHDYSLIIDARQEAQDIANRIHAPEAVLDGLHNNKFEPDIEGIRTKNILAVLS